MALTIITAGTTPATSATDIDNEIARLDAIALDPQKIFPIDFDNDEIPQGTVLNVGGAIMKAVTAESISGTASNYVKITASTRLASYVSSLSGVTWNSAYNGYYDVSGNLYLFDEVRAFFNYDILKVKKYADRQALAVNIYSGKEYFRFGTGRGAYSVSDRDITGLDETTIAVVGGGFIRVYKTTGTVLSEYATPLSVGTITFPYVAKMTSSLFSVIDSQTDTLRAYSLSGTTIALSGAAYTLPAHASGTIRLCGLSSTQSVIWNTNTSALQVMAFNGSTWTTAGSAYTLAGSGYFGMCEFDSTTFIIIIVSGFTITMQAYQFNGSTISTKGNLYTENASTNGRIKGAALGNNEFCVMSYEGSIGTIKTYSFDGTDILPSGGYTLFDDASNYSIAGMNSRLLIHSSSNTNRLEHYRRISV